MKWGLGAGVLVDIIIILFFSIKKQGHGGPIFLFVPPFLLTYNLLSFNVNMNEHNNVNTAQANLLWLFYIYLKLRREIYERTHYQSNFRTLQSSRLETHCDT